MVGCRHPWSLDVNMHHCRRKNPDHFLSLKSMTLRKDNTDIHKTPLLETTRELKHAARLHGANRGVEKASYAPNCLYPAIESSYCALDSNLSPCVDQSIESGMFTAYERSLWNCQIKVMMLIDREKMESLVAAIV
jgi:hypothetical protein